MRGIVFARRVLRELYRDPLSYVFCIATPVGMLLLFFIIYESMPVEAQSNIAMFRPDVMAPGIAFFGFAFVMLFGTLLVARDRSSAFFARLAATPMTPVDFLVGYSLPLLIIGYAQVLITYAVAAVLGAATGHPLSPVGCLLSLPALLPSLLFFIAVGLLFGALLSEMASPGITSVVVTLSGIMGGVWMPLSDAPVLEKICSVFPFYHGVLLARDAMARGSGEYLLHLGVLLAYTAAAWFGAALFLKKSLRNPK